MKKSYELYSPGTKVFGVSSYFDDKGDTHHYAIYPAIVNDVFIATDNKNNSEKVEYWLKTPSGEEWGDSVSADMVSDSFSKICKRLKVIWDKNANFVSG